MIYRRSDVLFCWLIYCRIRAILSHQRTWPYTERKIDHILVFSDPMRCQIRICLICCQIVYSSYKLSTETNPLQRNCLDEIIISMPVSNFTLKQSYEKQFPLFYKFSFISTNFQSFHTLPYYLVAILMCVHTCSLALTFWNTPF